MKHFFPNFHKLAKEGLRELKKWKYNMHVCRRRTYIRDSKKYTPEYQNLRIQISTNSTIW